MINLKAHTMRRWLWRGIVSVLLTGSATVHSFAAETEYLRAPDFGAVHSVPAKTIIRFDIPGQPLGPALTAYSSATGIPLFYSSRLAVGHQSRSVIGAFTAEQALAILLGDSGLAPLETTHNSITLILRTPDAAITVGNPISAPYMSLRTMLVSASPIGDHQFYAAAVRYSIRSALQRTDAAKRHSYQLDIDVWVSPAGMIRHAEILAPTERTDVEQAITHTIHGLVVGTPPPATLPQPVHVSILVGGHAL